MPAGHGTHVLDLSGICPAGHCFPQPAKPAVELVLPMLPLGHALQVVEPDLSAKVVAAQAEHCVAPLLDTNCPGKQGVQDLAPALENLPAGQLIHVPCPLGENVPGLQRVHDVWPPSCCIVPGGQEVHRTAPVPAEKVPMGHLAHVPMPLPVW